MATGSSEGSAAVPLGAQGPEGDEERVGGAPRRTWDAVPWLCCPRPACAPPGPVGAGPLPEPEHPVMQPQPPFLRSLARDTQRSGQQGALEVTTGSGKWRGKLPKLLDAFLRGSVLPKKWRRQPQTRALREVGQGQPHRGHFRTEGDRLPPGLAGLPELQDGDRRPREAVPSARGAGWWQAEPTRPATVSLGHSRPTAARCRWHPARLGLHSEPRAPRPSPFTKHPFQPRARSPQT